jgi:tight adherence protein B
MKILIYLLVIGAVLTIGHFIVGIAVTVWQKWQERHVQKLSSTLDDSFIFMEKQKLILVTSAPIILGLTGLLLVGNVVGAAIGFLLGLAAPAVFTSMARQRRIAQFQSQLVDTLMIFASSLKGGLSFVQALEVLCEEMPAPTSQEFGLVLKENRLGVSLEDSLNDLRNRMPLEEVNLIVSSILVAKETGGELTRVFSRLVETIRSNIKLKEKVNTLTLQGRLQGIIMSLMPLGFAIFIHRQNPDHFSIMFETGLGRNLLIGAVVLWFVGIFVIKKVSAYKG